MVLGRTPWKRVTYCRIMRQAADENNAYGPAYQIRTDQPLLSASPSRSSPGQLFRKKVESIVLEYMSHRCHVGAIREF